ncbi:MAG: mechanosensitive ion channel family protein [Magnetococcales bacterium]|nr:mechanosensitive ion channel family protein [Magnetococcales bacterium]MBF0419824.1 mechanosensitive ion channel family protein [Magnetococcales bacterium]
MKHEYWQIYGRLATAGLVLGLAVLLDDLFTRPLAFVSGIPQVLVGQYVVGIFCLILTLIISRVMRHAVLDGLVPAKTGKKLPQLVMDITGIVIVFLGICFIFAVVFKKDITALVATGGASVMIIGIALRDMVLSAFTGILLNVEKPFKQGDFIRVNDKWEGKVEKITWRATYIVTGNEGLLVVPNLTLSNAVIVNHTAPDTRTKRTLEVIIDYDTSVDSAERILYAATLGAPGVIHVGPPRVVAIRVERDGVVYQVAFTISDYDHRWKSDHAVIKNILRHMRDAGITVSFPKSEIIQTQHRAQIADRSLDILRLVQQCRIFQPLPVTICKRIADMLVERHFAANATIVNAGERRYSLFIVGEGMVKRSITNRDGAMLVTERFIATETFGRRALFGCQPQVAAVVAETAALVYELDRNALMAILREDPALIDSFSHSLALQSWRESHDVRTISEPGPAEIKRLSNLYRGQIHAAYLVET